MPRRTPSINAGLRSLSRCFRSCLAGLHQPNRISPMFYSPLLLAQVSVQIQGLITALQVGGVASRFHLQSLPLPGSALFEPQKYIPLRSVLPSPAATLRFRPSYLGRTHQAAHYSQTAKARNGIVIFAYAFFSLNFMAAPHPCKHCLVCPGRVPPGPYPPKPPGRQFIPQHPIQSVAACHCPHLTPQLL